MSKWTETPTTRDMEKAILGHRWGMGRYHFWEVTMPDSRERVDMIEFTWAMGDIFLEVGEWNFYELKLSIKDLKDGRPCTWRGDRNYLVCPESMGEEAAKLIPDYVGVYVVTHEEIEDVHGFGRRFACSCLRKAKQMKHETPALLTLLPACVKAGSRAFDTLKGRTH